MTALTLDTNAQATIVISDVHIGTNYPTCWYQAAVHEPYLATLLDWVIHNAASVKELVILGDLFDFWTYPPTMRPPTIQDIVQANPTILGPNGKLAQVLDALDGRVKYLTGNHDMNVTQGDLNAVGNPAGPHITLINDPTYIDRDTNAQYTHGHYTTLFNAPDRFNTRFGGLPLGQFVTRAVAYMVEQHLKTMPSGTTAADLPGQGSSYDVDFSAFFRSIVPNVANPSLAKVFLDYVINYTGVPRDTPVVLQDGSSVPIGQVGDVYENLWTQWEQQYGLLYTYKAAMADYDGSYMGWFSLMATFRSNVHATVMGHTHVPKLGLPLGMDVTAMNTGFECPARPDMTRPANPLRFTFGQVVPGGYVYMGQVIQRPDGSHAVQSASAPRDWVVSPNAAGDFSCYVTVICPPGFRAERVGSAAAHGTYVVEPPAVLESGGTYRFWLQDLPGVRGTEGTVQYRVTSGSRAGQMLNLSFECPLIFSNDCSGAPFRTKSGEQQSYGPEGQVATRGHPFFVQFQL